MQDQEKYLVIERGCNIDQFNLGSAMVDKGGSQANMGWWIYRCLPLHMLVWVIVDTY